MSSWLYDKGKRIDFYVRCRFKFVKAKIWTKCCFQIDWIFIDNKNKCKSYHSITDKDHDDVIPSKWNKFCLMVIMITHQRMKNTIINNDDEIVSSKYYCLIKWTKNKNMKQSPQSL